MATREENINALTAAFLKLSAGVNLSDAVDSDKSTLDGTAATPKAVKTAYDYTTDVAQSVLEAAKNATEGSDNVTDLREPLLADVYHEIGTWWISLDNSIPVGGLPHLGHLCARDTYGEFWPWCETNKTVVSDEEWLAYAESHNGCCPWYSYGDGSTTFRTPKYDQSFLKVLATIGGTGEMEEAGLPNITGHFGYTAQDSNVYDVYGAFRHAGWTGGGAYYTDGTVRDVDADFDASLSSSIYGNSDTVTPQNFGIIVGVYAVGAVSAPVGETDAANLLNGLSTLETGKASVDLSNLSTEGRSLVAGLGMPNERYVDLTVGAHGSNYTAPANGWFTAYVSNTAASLLRVAFLSGKVFASVVLSETTSEGLYIPVRKGDDITLYITGSPNFIYFRFCYAEGEEA